MDRDPDNQLIRIGLSLTPALIRRLDERRRYEPDLPGRGELIRRMLERALDEVERQGSKKGPHKAS
jgi:metal-responsive CopG/Arc/MetJ family transcriptional regulator